MAHDIVTGQEPRHDAVAASAHLSTHANPHPSTRPRRVNEWWHVLLAPVMGLVLLAIWALVAEAELYARFIVPTPASVAQRWWELAADGSLLRHTAVTLREVLTGLIVGVLAAFGLGYWIAKNRLVAAMLMPYLVAWQAVPIVAIAPLLIIWFDAGIASKVLICALIVFFPMLVNTVVGIRNIPPELRDLMRALEASPWQTFLYLDLPAAMPVVIGGLKVSATLSVIGAVVGEFVSASEGLGYLINFGRGIYDTPLVIAAVFTLTALALALYGLAAWLERVLLAWQHAERPESY